jgi:hypothetical protein
MTAATPPDAPWSLKDHILSTPPSSSQARPSSRPMRRRTGSLRLPGSLPQMGGFHPSAVSSDGLIRSQNRGDPWLTEDSDSDAQRTLYDADSLEGARRQSRREYQSDAETIRKIRRRSVRKPYRQTVKLDLIPLFDLEVFEIEPRPFDDSRLCALLSDAWLGEGRFGESGENLFRYYAEIEGDDAMDFEALRERTLELLGQVQSGIPDGQPTLALRHFLSLHRFYALILDDTLVPYEKVSKSLRPFVSLTFHWLICYLKDCLFPQFLTALAAGGSAAKGTQISQFRETLADKFGQFIWERVLIAVDMELANLLLTDDHLTTLKSIEETSDHFGQLCGELDLRMPYFTEALSFTLNYAMVLRDSIPFEEIAPDLRMDFLLALLFAGKRKRIIPLEISDKRILAEAEQQNVDISRVEEFRLICDESTADIPQALWTTATSS